MSGTRTQYGPLGNVKEIEIVRRSSCPASLVLFAQVPVNYDKIARKGNSVRSCGGKTVQ